MSFYNNIRFHCFKQLFYSQKQALQSLRFHACDVMHLFEVIVLYWLTALCTLLSVFQITVGMPSIYTFCSLCLDFCIQWLFKINHWYQWQSSIFLLHALYSVIFHFPGIFLCLDWPTHILQILLSNSQRSLWLIRKKEKKKERNNI